MAKVRISAIDKSFARKHIQDIENLADQHTSEMAHDTEDVMKQEITDSIVRPGSTGNLANSIFTEKVEGGYGVGNIEYLNTNAKQWYWLNYGVAQTGRTTPPNVVGSFSPGNPRPSKDDFRTGRFTQGNGFLMVPKKAIEAKNYIEKTIAKIPGIIQSVLRRVK